MSLPRRSDRTAPLLLLLLSLLSIYCIRHLLFSYGRAGESCPQRHYVQVCGDVSRSGVFVFCTEPSMQEALGAAGLDWTRAEGPEPAQPELISGARLIVARQGGRVRLDRREMNGFFKMTLGIPLSINSESEVGLTALPGIGPGLAKAIAEERTKREGFQSLEDLTSVRGIGVERLAKIRPYLKL